MFTSLLENFSSKSLYSKDITPKPTDPSQTDEALELLSLLEESDPSSLIDTVDIEDLLQQHIDTKTEPPTNMSTFK